MVKGIVVIDMVMLVIVRDKINILVGVWRWEFWVIVIYISIFFRKV